MRGRGAIGLALLLGACGGTTIVAANDAGHDASATTGGAGGLAGAGGAGGAVGFDAPDEPVNPWADSGAIDGGPFLCGGCVCNGATNYCYTASGGMFRDLSDAATCPDSGSYGCIALPSACAGVPSCACLAAFHAPGACQCDSTSGGVSVTCAFP